MARLRAFWVARAACCGAWVVAGWALGCGTSSPPPSGSPSPAAEDKAAVSSSAEPTPTAATDPGVRSSSGGGAESTPYPDVPAVPLMAEVDGIEIPRLRAQGQRLDLKAAIPVDVGNAHAQQRPGEKATGDALTIRFESEPKVLNPIVETSAVAQYINMLTNAALAFQNFETFEYEPDIASRWVAEDSVKLSPDYPGKERRVALEGGDPAATLEINYTLPPKPADGGKAPEPPQIKLITADGAGQPLGRVWVGVFPVEKIVGAPVSGYHLWSNEQGELAIGGFPTGKYVVKVGAEVYGQSRRGDDGSLTVTPATPENPLHQELQAGGATSLALKPGEWIDVQEQTYLTFYLNPDVKWADGAPFTATDLAFAYAVVNNPAVDADSLRVYYQDLVECAPLSSHVVRTRYRQQYFKAFEFSAGLALYAPPFHRFTQLIKEKLGRELTLDRLTPAQEAEQGKVSAHGAEFGKFFNTDPSHNRSPLGTAQFTVARWERGNLVELVRNPNYGNQRKPAYLDKIIIKFIPDNVTAMAALKAGEIDFFWRITPEQFFEDLQGPPDWFQGKYVKSSWFIPTFSYFGWNMLKPEFQDRRVRIAMSLLFDKESFRKEKLYGEAEIVSGPQYYFGPGYDHSVAPIGYDPEAARDLLAEAGWVDTDGDGLLDKDGRAMKFDLPLAQGNPVNVQLAQVFQKAAKDAGIQIDVQQLEWASFLDKIKAKSYDICLLRWTMPLESDPYQIWHSSGASKESRGSNHVSFANKQADELIEMLRLTLDPAKRQQINVALHRVIDREQPYMFLYCTKDFAAYHQRFRGVKWYRLRPGFDLTEWYVPKDEQVHK